MFFLNALEDVEHWAAEAPAHRQRGQRVLLCGAGSCTGPPTSSPCLTPCPQEQELAPLMCRCRTVAVALTQTAFRAEFAADRFLAIKSA